MNDEEPAPPDADAARTMHIGEVAARTNLSLRSLRHWESVGLLRPTGRSVGGFRQYTAADVEKIMVIRRMKPLGFTLERMSAAMRDIEELDDREPGDHDQDAARARLATILQEATERRAELQRQLAMADEFIDLLSQRIT